MGTLDPKVTGVLPVTLGRACKLAGYFIRHDKTYVGVLETHKVCDIVELQKLIDDNFVGKIRQTPPHRSAVLREERIREVFFWRLLEVGKGSASPEEFDSLNRKGSSQSDGEVHAKRGGLEFPEVFIIENKLKPGELGKTKEHLLGYYYVQEISSMLPMLALKPEAGDMILDLCASPGSKTTQAAAMMNNEGTIIANELSMGRIGILNSNLEGCGVMNTIVTRKEGVAFCERMLKKSNFRFDKILVDAPCSGEGTLRKSPKTFQMWNVNMIKKFAGVQRKLVSAAIKLLKVRGTMIYSTCTLAPEEDEGVVDYLVRNFDVEVEKIDLPLKFRCGVTAFGNVVFDSSVSKCLRLYPQDNNTDGFFVAKIRTVSERGCE